MLFISKPDRISLAPPYLHLKFTNDRGQLIRATFIHIMTANDTPNAVLDVWSPDDEPKVPIYSKHGEGVYRPDIQDAIERTIQSLDSELRALSLDIHGALAGLCYSQIRCISLLSYSIDHPELQFEEQLVAVHDASY